MPEIISRAPIPAKPKNVTQPIVGRPTRSFVRSAKSPESSAVCVNHSIGTITVGTFLNSLEKKTYQSMG
jgi:hypothetical protein